MSDYTAAIEAAARAQWPGWRGCLWEHGDESDHENFRKYARIDIEAAAPIIEAQALREAAADYAVKYDESQRSRPTTEWLRARADAIEAS